MKIRFIFLYLLVFLFLNACGGGGSAKLGSGGEDPNNYRGTLINSELVGTKSGNFLIPYDVKAYKIIYSTIDVNGNKIKASGLLGVPQKAKSAKSPLLSYQHGTNFLNKNAPSNSSSTADAIMRFAGTGYVISAADYIGYGESKGQIHPYIHAETLASASIDMIRASKQFLQSQNIHINSQLFLAGYSEGGYATLALQKAIQEKHANEFRVTASAAGAGPYDLTETAKIMANKATNNSPAYMSFLLKAYDSIYALNKISEMYQSQYVNVINTSFDGTHSSRDINNQLSSNTEELFEPSFLEALRGTGTHILKDKLALNNLYNWKPTAPTRLFHGSNDEIVPYSNSQKALETMRANGATISLGDCSLNTHVQCAFPYAIDARNFFNKYVDDL